MSELKIIDVTNDGIVTAFLVSGGKNPNDVVVGSTAPLSAFKTEERTSADAWNEMPSDCGL